MILNSPSTLIRSILLRSCAWTTEHLIIAMFVYSSELLCSLNPAPKKSSSSKYGVPAVVPHPKQAIPTVLLITRPAQDANTLKLLPRNLKLDRSIRRLLPIKPPSFTTSCKKIVSMSLQSLKPGFLQMHPRRSKLT